LARSVKDLCEHLNTRFGELKSIRNSWESGWRDIARYQIPEASDFLRSANQGDRGTKKDGQIMDGIAGEALDVLRAGLMGGLTPRTQPWFRLTVADEKVANSAAVKFWLDHVAERMLMVFGQSNLYETLHSLYGETAASAPAAR
jgi:hypothetical protein